MKKVIIATIVGAIITFGWQSSSHMFMGLHDDAYKRTESQDTAIAAFSQFFKEEGQYMVPRAADGVSHEEAEAYMKSRAGKPWALVTYHASSDPDMVMPIIRCFLVHIFCVWLVVLVARRLAVKSFSAIFFTALTFGIVCFMYTSYINHIWLQTPWSVLKGELVDDLATWGLCGIWLGWYLKR